MKKDRFSRIFEYSDGPVRLAQQSTYLAKRDIKCICTGFSTVHKIGSIFIILPSKISHLKGIVM